MESRSGARFLGISAEALTTSQILNYSADVDYSKIITIEPGKRSGKPCIRGIRITVQDVFEYLAGGMTEDQILARRRLRPARRIRQFGRDGCRTAGFSRLAYGGTEDLMRGDCLGAISILRLLFHWGVPVKRILFKISLAPGSRSRPENP
jgi:hypothetical protein